MIVIIGMYVIFGALYTDGDSLPMMGGAFTLFSLFIVFLLTVRHPIPPFLMAQSHLPIVGGLS